MATPPLPTFLIVGVMKAGTTSLAAWLGAHPDVFVAPQKEIHFFDTPDRYRRGLDLYRSHFAGATGERAVGEASPSYMVHPIAPMRIAKDLPDVRLIASLRNPVERAYSEYWHHREVGKERRDFAELVRHDLANPSERPDVIVRGRYLQHLERLCTLFPREALLVLLFEDLVAFPADTFAAACAHIGVDPAERPAILGSTFNPRPHLRSPRLHKVVRRALRTRVVPKRPAQAVERWNLRPPVMPPPMDPAVRRLLVEVYAEDNLALGRWLGRDLSGWNAVPEE